MYKVFTILCFFLINKNCIQSIENKYLHKNVEVLINIKKINDCRFFCYFLEITIANNDENGIYMPLYNKYELIDIFNDKGNSIINNLITYESLNELSNYGLEKEDNSSLKIIEKLENIYNLNNSKIDYDVKIMNDIFKKDSFTYSLSKSKMHPNELNNLANLTKNTIIETKYGDIAFVPAFSSRKLFIPINYLFQNFVVEGYPIKPFYINHGNAEEKKIFEENYSSAWSDYKKIKTNNVKIIFRYDLDYLRNNLWESDSIITIPISYEKENKDSIVITKKYPKKLLNNFYLLKKIKTDTLVLDLIELQEKE